MTEADVSEVARAVGTDHRIGSKFLQASVGFGGSCFQKVRRCGRRTHEKRAEQSRGGDAGRAAPNSATQRLARTRGRRGFSLARRSASGTRSTPPPRQRVANTPGETSRAALAHTRPELTSSVPRCWRPTPPLRLRLSAQDILNLVYLCESFGLHEVAEYWNQVVKMNEWQKRRFSQMMVRRMFNTVTGKKLAIFGFAFKKDTGDTRETASAFVMRDLIEEMAKLHVYDPQVKREQMFEEFKYTLNLSEETKVRRVNDDCTHDWRHIVLKTTKRRARALYGCAPPEPTGC